MVQIPLKKICSTFERNVLKPEVQPIISNGVVMFGTQKLLNRQHCCQLRYIASGFFFI